jgi:hypothetical protein
MLTHLVEIAAAFLTGILVARVYGSRLISEGKRLAADVKKKL